MMPLHQALTVSDVAIAYAHDFAAGETEALQNEVSRLTYERDQYRNRQPSFSHDVLVRVVQGSPEILEFIANTQKIRAIKELRALTFCGLKEAKEAVEAVSVF